MNNYTVRVTMKITAEIDVSATSRDMAKQLAMTDYDAVWAQADVDDVAAHIIEEDGKDV